MEERERFTDSVFLEEDTERERDVEARRETEIKKQRDKGHGCVFVPVRNLLYPFYTQTCTCRH